MNLEEAKKLMGERDHSTLLCEEDQRLNLLGLADLVPGLVSEIKSLQAQLAGVHEVVDAAKDHRRIQTHGNACICAICCALRTYDNAQKKGTTLLHRVRFLEDRLALAHRVVDEASSFERAATEEMNEKGAGGFALARLSDLRNALKEYQKEYSGLCSCGHDAESHNNTHGILLGSKETRCDECKCTKWASSEE